MLRRDGVGDLFGLPFWLVVECLRSAEEQKLLKGTRKDQEEV